MWLFEDRIIGDEDDFSDYVGFVYLITNKLNGRRYIGKKLLKFSRTKQVKGKKKKVKVDSDWKTYFGSNEALKEDVAEFGADNFERKILRFCKTKGECSYYEAKYQFEFDVLIGTDFYNSWISCKIHQSHLKNLQ